jgi:hypothetical protein
LPSSSKSSRGLYRIFIFEQTHSGRHPWNFLFQLHLLSGTRGWGVVRPAFLQCLHFTFVAFSSLFDFVERRGVRLRRGGDGEREGDRDGEREAERDGDRRRAGRRSFFRERLLRTDFSYDDSESEVAAYTSPYVLVSSF